METARLEITELLSMGETCNGAPTNYLLSIRSVIPGSQVELDNFAGLFWDVTAFVNGNNISIPSQSVSIL